MILPFLKYRQFWNTPDSELITNVEIDVGVVNFAVAVGTVTVADERNVIVPVSLLEVDTNTILTAPNGSDLVNVFVTEVRQDSNRNLSIDLTSLYLVAGTEIGVEVWDDITLLGSPTTIVTADSESANIETINFTIPVKEDVTLTFVCFATILAVRTYTEAEDFSYFHWGVYPQLPLQIIDAPAANYVDRIEIGLDQIQNVHGSILYNGYVYGSPRYQGNGNTNIVKYPVGDPQAFSFIELDFSSEFVGYNLQRFEALVRVGRYLYSMCIQFQASTPNPPADGVNLLQIDTLDDSWKIFAIDNLQLDAWVPVISDGTYLYLGGDEYLYKVDPTIFQNATEQINLDIFWKTIIPNWGLNSWTYDMGSQGGYIDYPETGYTALMKGLIHSADNDAEYLYLSFTTAAGGSGYRPEWDITTYELHIVRISDMTAVVWRYIPKSTDDMTQNADHLFFGIELAGSNPLEFGHGWGAYALKKSELLASGPNAPIYGLPKLHELDDGAPVASSYASLVFGNYLLDFKDNKYLFIIDIADVANWLPDEDIGKRTLAIFNIIADGSPFLSVPNEAMLNTDSYFHIFLWYTPSGIVKIQIPGFSFFEPASVDSVSSVVDKRDVTLQGYILNENGSVVTEEGFEYGLINDTELFDRIPVVGTPRTFELLIEDLFPSVYFWRAYAINSSGEGFGEVESFEILPVSAVSEVQTISFIETLLPVTVDRGIVVNVNLITFVETLLSPNAEASQNVQIDVNVSNFIETLISPIVTISFGVQVDVNLITFIESTNEVAVEADRDITINVNVIPFGLIVYTPDIEASGSITVNVNLISFLETLSPVTITADKDVQVDVNTIDFILNVFGASAGSTTNVQVDVNVLNYDLTIDTVIVTATKNIIADVEVINYDLSLFPLEIISDRDVLVDVETIQFNLSVRSAFVGVINDPDLIRVYIGIKLTRTVVEESLELVETINKEDIKLTKTNYESNL